MGMNEKIYELESQGFKIRTTFIFLFSKSWILFFTSFVIFPKEKAQIWEDFVKDNLEINYWNEYLTEDKVIFLFNLFDGIHRYEVENFDNDEVLTICEELCDWDFGSIKDMLLGNKFYKKILTGK